MTEYTHPQPNDGPGQDSQVPDQKIKHNESIRRTDQWAALPPEQREITDLTDVPYQILNPSVDQERDKLTLDSLTKAIRDKVIQKYAQELTELGIDISEETDKTKIIEAKDKAIAHQRNKNNK